MSVIRSPIRSPIYSPLYDPLAGKWAEVVEEPETDPDFANVVLLVDFDGDATDDSNSGHTLTASGNATTNTTDPPSFQSASAVLDGTGDYWTIADSDDFHFGSGDFTIEGWVRTHTSGWGALLAQWGADNKAWLIGVDGNVSAFFYWSDDGTTDRGPVDYPHTIGMQNQWFHIAASRVGNTLYFAFDGAIRDTADVTGVALNNSTRPVVFGANENGASGEHNGRLAQWRVTKGVGRYSGSVNDPITVDPPFPRS